METTKNPNNKIFTVVMIVLLTIAMVTCKINASADTIEYGNHGLLIIDNILSVKLEYAFDAQSVVDETNTAFDYDNSLSSGGWAQYNYTEGKWEYHKYGKFCEYIGDHSNQAFANLKLVQIGQTAHIYRGDHCSSGFLEDKDITCVAIYPKCTWKSLYNGDFYQGEFLCTPDGTFINDQSFGESVVIYTCNGKYRYVTVWQ